MTSINVKVPVNWENEPKNTWAWHKYFIVDVGQGSYQFVLYGSRELNSYRTLDEAQTAAVNHFIESIGGERNG